MSKDKAGLQWEEDGLGCFHHDGMRRHSMEEARGRSSMEKVFQVAAALIREGPAQMDAVHNG